MLPAFSAWCGRLRFGVATYAILLLKAKAIRTIGRHVQTLTNTKRELHHSIHVDTGQRIQDAAAAAATVSTSDVVSSLHCLLGPSARRSRPTHELPSLQKADGTMAQSPEEETETWIQHFSGIEGGKSRTPVELVASAPRPNGQEI